MMLRRIIFTYLGFCPSKDSDQSFRIKNNASTARLHIWKPRSRMMMFIGVLLIFAGLMPFFLEDSSIAGVTDSIILHCRLGLASFILGVVLIILGAIIPLIITKLNFGGVEGEYL
jgi:hypothetical protein